MRHRWLPFWLIVCVLVSQMALARHVVFHTAAALAAASSAGSAEFAASPDTARRHTLPGPRDDDGEGICEQCLAFIAVDVALPALPLFASLPPSREWHYPPATPVHVRSVLLGPTRNRDPPRLDLLIV